MFSNGFPRFPDNHVIHVSVNFFGTLKTSQNVVIPMVYKGFPAICKFPGIFSQAFVPWQLHKTFVF